MFWLVWNQTIAALCHNRFQQFFQTAPNIFAGYQQTICKTLANDDGNITIKTTLTFSWLRFNLVFTDNNGNTLESSQIILPCSFDCVSEAGRDEENYSITEVGQEEGVILPWHWYQLLRGWRYPITSNNWLITEYKSRITYSLGVTLVGTV